MNACSRCGQPATSHLWDQTSCADCRAVWFASERTTSGAVDKALGFAWVRGQGPLRAGEHVAAKDYLNETCDEYRRLARAWAAGGKRP